MATSASHHRSNCASRFSASCFDLQCRHGGAITIHVFFEQGWRANPRRRASRQFRHCQSSRQQFWPRRRWRLPGNCDKFIRRGHECRCASGDSCCQYRGHNADSSVFFLGGSGDEHPGRHQCFFVRRHCAGDQRNLFQRRNGDGKQFNEPCRIEQSHHTSHSECI